MNREILHKFAEKWLEVKKGRMQNLLKIAYPDEALYREIMLSLGYPKNKTQFLELALILPYREIRRLSDRETIKKALLYRAGFSSDKKGLPADFDFSLKMDKSAWVFRGVRPYNFPPKRIEGIVDLLAKSLSDGIVNFFLRNIRKEIYSQSSLKTRLKNIMNFEGIGIARKEEMFFNIILPFFLVYDSPKEVKGFLMCMFEKYPSLSENSAIRKFKKRFDLEIKTFKDYIGAVFYVKEIL